VVSMLASGTQDRGFKAVGFFRAKKSSACLPSREEKPSDPCHRFLACKRTLHLMWNSSNDGKVCPLFLTHGSHVAWRGTPLEMTGGTTKTVHRGPAVYRPRCDRVVAL
jgi:hypothetical protein